ncbi:4'-phosphopantetheinyl transferase family protein [Legionella brunensis]|uniref:Phosphopantetheinyl transferase n=1 Tax=Legionella brunensis TaxID=29422 RepID=A0A0W0SE22_9GAMM|nr:4'-phosphopantetheinyl transferase superfamily protein [Legionella brunensis]KTC81403.1 phosphopantetheinyl transferase [Legionella brunensis]
MALFQPIPSNNYVLQQERVDIWEFSLANLPLQATSLLNEEECKRANRFYFPRHQRRFTVARAMLRAILGAYLKQEAASISFVYNQHGKPWVKNPFDLEFNLSHSGELALLAIGQAFPLGIDLELFSSRPYKGMAKNIFSPQELVHFSKLPKHLEPLAFFHLWAQKEALIKACGLGLSYPTQQFDVPVTPPTNALIVDHKHQRHWQMISFMPKVACSAALCCDPQIKIIRYGVVNPLDFL